MVYRYEYDKPTTGPQESPHWKALTHRDGDACIQNLDELRQVLVSDLAAAAEDGGSASSGLENPARLALWSCVLGYCEALSTHKSPQARYSIYPIPIDALERLVTAQFKPPRPPSAAEDANGTTTSSTSNWSNWRRTAQSVANWVWSQVASKANAKDELHANSLYTVLQGGRIDKKSVDCFGAALVTVIGLRMDGYKDSMLTLSEDHAYESHYEPASQTAASARGTSSSNNNNGVLCTCEVAIPGNTKAQKAKRAHEIAKTFENNSFKKSKKPSHSDDDDDGALTPQTSWLYMGMGPVYCRTSPMILAAALANLNSTIAVETVSSSGATTSNITKPQQEQYRPGDKVEINSEDLLRIKRDLLWVLKDRGHLDQLPFALCELGWSEEHCTSPRGDAMMPLNISKADTAAVPSLLPSTSGSSSSNQSDPAATTTEEVQVTAIESLYHQAIACNQTQYNNCQVYPYCYMGYYHKDGGQDEEYRFGLALKYFYLAAKVASRYKYEWGDSLQLTKVMTKISEFVMYEIWSSTKSSGRISSSSTSGRQKQRQPARVWQDQANAAVAARWLLAFYDALLVWEERTNSRFLPILQSNHKTGIAKVFSLISQDIRIQAFQSLTSSSSSGNGNDAAPVILQSTRLRGALGTALQKATVSLSDLELTIVSEGRGRRARKRKGVE